MFCVLYYPIVILNFLRYQATSSRHPIMYSNQDSVKMVCCCFFFLIASISVKLQQLQKVWVFLSLIHMWTSRLLQTITFLEIGEMDFGQVLVLGFSQFVHAVHVLYVPCVSFDKCFLIIHDIFVGWLLQSINLNWSEMTILDYLDELKFLHIQLHLVTIGRDCCREGLTHFSILNSFVI